MPVLRILHGTGNLRDLLPLAEHPAVDAIEADIWTRGDQLVAHEHRPLGPLSLALGRDGVHRVSHDPIDLSAILEAIGCAGPRTQVVLNLRSRVADPAPDLARELLALPDRSHMTVRCAAWPIVDRLRAWVPHLDALYSIGYEPQVRRYVYEANASTLPRRPIAIRESLLHSAEEVHALRRYAGTVAAWTVDDVDRAQELAEWGVDAVVSNQVTVLNAL